MDMKKLELLYKKISGYAIVHAEKLQDWQFRKCIFVSSGVYENCSKAFTVSPGFQWGEKGDTGFFERTVTVPEHFRGYSVYIDVETGGEAEIFIDGKAFQGNDPNHSRALLLVRAQGGEAFDINIESFVRTGYNGFGEPKMEAGGSGYFRTAGLCAVDKVSEDFLQDIKTAVLYGLEFQEYASIIENSLTRIFTSFDITSREQFREYVPQGKKILSGLSEKLPIMDSREIHMIGQSHLDFAWLWRKGESRRKVVRTFSSAVRLSERFKDHRFMMPQAMLYKILKEEAPCIYEEVKRLIREGRFENAGLFYVEPDTNLVSGESLVRQILAGRQLYMNEFNRVGRSESLIDAFGYSGNLPQIFKKSGIDHVMVTKMMWYNDTNEFPYTAFHWKGIDGTSVLAATMPWFNRQCTPREIRLNLEKARQKDKVKQLAVFYGWGDGGGGADEGHLYGLEGLLEWQKPVRIHASGMEEYFHALEEDAEGLPVWRGEIYQEGHRGCYTTQSDIKKRNVEAENFLRSAEILTSFASILGRDLKTDLHEALEIMILNQFHDILPGSSIGVVYEDAKEDYERLFEICSRQMKSAISTMVVDKKSDETDFITVLNFSGASSALVRIDSGSDYTNGYLYGPDGGEIPFEIQGNEMVFSYEGLPRYGMAVFQFVPAEKKQLVKELDAASGGLLENEYIKAAFDKSGRLLSVYDKELQREFIKSNGKGNRLTVHFDFPYQCDAWDIDGDHVDNFEELIPEGIEYGEQTSLHQMVRVHYHYGQSSIMQEIYLYNGRRDMEFKTFVDWKENHRLLKASFDVDIQSPKAHYKIPFGVMERDAWHNDSHQRAKFEVPSLGFADFSEPSGGAALISPVKFGYSVDDHTMSISLLRAPTHPDRFADRGHHVFSYYFTVHPGDYREGKVLDTLRSCTPYNLIAVKGAPVGVILENNTCDFINIAGKGVMLEAFKGAEDGKGYILRLCEYHGSHDKVEIKLCSTAKKIMECNLVEEDMAVIRESSDTFTCKIAPYEIKSFRLIF